MSSRRAIWALVCPAAGWASVILGADNTDTTTTATLTTTQTVDVNTNDTTTSTLTMFGSYDIVLTPTPSTAATRPWTQTRPCFRDHRELLAASLDQSQERLHSAGVTGGAAAIAEKIRASYGSNHGRLRQLKARYDPTNLFRLNPNIPPA